jgi:restriction system protein
VTTASRGYKLYWECKEQKNISFENFLKYVPLTKKVIPQKVKERQTLIEPMLSQHIPALARNKKKLTRRDDYGVVIVSPKWEKELTHFKTNIVQSLQLQHHTVYEVMLLIEVAIESYKPSDDTNIADIKTGEEYECFCAALFETAGWETSLTNKTGDQGVDIIARKNGTVVSVQCKYYSKPVGNKAVQEIAAGRVHHGAGIAVVVSNSSFTRSAIELAQTTGVILIHHEEIQKLSERI